MRENSGWIKMFSVIKDKITTGFSVFWHSVKSFIKNDNSSAAASLAYYSLFALIPLLLLLFFALSFFITSSKAIMQKLTILISQFIPYYSETILNEVYTLARHKGMWKIISLVALLWMLMPLMSALRTVFYNIFKVEKRPSFLKTNILDLSVILLTLSLLVVVSFSNVAFKRFLVLGGSTLPYDIASYLLTAAVISIFYLVFIPVRVPFSYIFAGSVLTTLLWGIIRPLFGLLLTYNPQYGITFGSLKALFIIIIWIYYSFSVLLFGTELIANLRRKDVLLLRGLFYETQTDRRTQKLKRKFGRDYKAGEIIFEEGEKGSEMFYILSGSVRLIKKEQTLRIMRKGEYFGEMALLIGTSRTTSARAEEDNTSLAVITPENFEMLLREEPKIAISFLKELAHRLKKTNEILQ
ncbi:MAG: YihY family inner membrane protein [Nitrospirae bacterium]|nr:YihY family inner membrane protein [Nitrospirota bacterium]MBI3376942.1 YihY family inner membrane protein [Nitrospirota bacterium]